MKNTGQFIGSVSGGCVEESLLARYCNGELAGPAPTMVDFGVGRQEAMRMGLPCGGRLELLIEQLPEPESIEQLLTRLRDGELVTRKVNLANGEASLYPGDHGPEFQLTETELLKTFGPAWRSVGIVCISSTSLSRRSFI